MTGPNGVHVITPRGRPADITEETSFSGDNMNHFTSTVAPSQVHSTTTNTAHPSDDNMYGSLQNETAIPDEGSATLSFQDMCYSVNIRTKCCSSVPKPILRSVSGIFRPGLNAIMGATGSGKTSLLDVMAARKDPAGLDGNIYLNGQPRPPNFRLMTGYVVQDDVVMGTLTVRENFMFSANLRLPSHVTTKEKEIKVESIVNELGLPHVADMKVGTEFIRGISGGERKRTNIGMELIISPKVLFLDEPSTGLDASTANAVLLLLHRLGKRGRTIIMSIHQPRYSIYKLFDHLVLLSRGYLVYQGPGQEALPYFSSIGYECEAHNNPADFFLDVINGDSTAVQINTERKGNEDSAELQAIAINQSTTSEDQLAVELKDRFMKSQWYSDLMQQVKASLSSINGSGGSTEVKTASDEYPTSFFTQVGVLSKRTVKNIIRNPQTSVMQSFVMVIFALLVGTIYFRMDFTFNGLANRTGAFFFIIMNQIFGNLSAVELFIKERKIFVHENSNGFYRVSAYFLSKLFCDVIPMRFIPNTGFCLIVYFMTGLQVDVGKFFFFLLAVSVTSLAASSLGFFFSATVSVFALANLCIALCYVFMMVFSGFLVQLDSVLGFLQWIKWVSIFRYGLNALSINELVGLTFCDKIPNSNASRCTTGEAQLKSMSMDYETTWDLWSNVVALAGMAFILLILTYVQLRRINKYT